MKERVIGNIGNYYGSLTVKMDSDKFYWHIEDWDGHERQEIPESLFIELNKFQDSAETNNDN